MTRLSGDGIRVLVPLKTFLCWEKAKQFRWSGGGVYPNLLHPHVYVAESLPGVARRFETAKIVKGFRLRRDRDGDRGWSRGSDMNMDRDSGRDEDRGRDRDMDVNVGKGRDGDKRRGRVRVTEGDRGKLQR